MTGKDEFKQVSLEQSGIKLQIGLPLNADGTVPDRFQPFESVSSLAKLWQRVSMQLGEGQQVNHADGQAIRDLMELMLEPGGDKFLKAIKEEFRRNQVGAILKQIGDRQALEAVGLNNQAMADLDSKQRRVRRIKQRSKGK